MTPDLLLYIGAAALALFAAVSELIGRFRDAPYTAVFSPSGSIYLLLNATLAAIVLGGLRFADPPKTTITALEQLLLAGFGARMVLRSSPLAARTAQRRPDLVQSSKNCSPRSVEPLTAALRPTA
jgi:hypothetical protein